ncbi:speckle-type POZ protein B-like [Microplitis mediator]|uniref:speckle-type POZ protein B-like n=1 Tax=Microplitis mediator TaxID=375433 RepID=UPI002552A39F|nr:speckle-type POZ protein B-like [Microplitis mediator]XP_057318495.1 speckle-type POZ protein B-like [Microplitis mediator]
MEILAYSHCQKHRVIYKWKINEITSFIESAHDDETTAKLSSPDFTTNGKTGTSWFLQLSLLQEPDWISLYLCRKDGNDNRRVQLSLFILDNKNKRQFLKTSCGIRDFTIGRGISKFVEIKELLKNKDDLLPNNTLTACVELTVYEDYQSSLTKISLQPPRRQITDDLKELYDSKTNSDVTFVVGNEKFKAHKLIMSTRSPVFFAMFTHEMKENRESEVTIPDIEPEVFNKLLEFIYTDKITNLDADAAYLLEAADKYQLLNLKSLCEESLSKSASIDNAIELMILADLHNANQLFEHALELIIKNIEAIIKTPEYKILEESKPLLLSKLIEKLATSIKNNASADEK